MFTTPHRDSILGVMAGTTYTGFSSFVGLLTVITNWRTPTVTEASYTGYATRPGITFGAAADTSPAGGRQRANSALCTFPQNTGTTQDMIGYGIYDASTAGNLKGIGLMDADVPILGVANDTTTEDLIAPAHGLSTDQRVFVLAAPGAVIPTGLAENTAYFVLAVGLTTDQFRLAATSGGAAINITAKGAALFIPYTALTVANLATPEFAIGTIIVQV